MRTFIAIELPEEIKKRLEELEEILKKFLPLRFVSPANLHLTLFFLGEIDKVDIPKIIEAVKTGTRGIKPFHLFLDKPEFFPQKGRIHGLWLKVRGQLEVLDKLYQQVAQELGKRNFEFGHKPFSAHITLGRTKKKIRRQPLSSPPAGEAGLVIEPPRQEKFKVDSVSVFTSVLKSEGPIYSRVAKIDLI